MNRDVLSISSPARWLRLHGVGSGLVFLLCFNLNGCSGPERSRDPDIPKPGEMILMSVEPVPSSQEENLIPNGAFDDYYAGAYAPTGPYSYPAPNPLRSKIDRAISTSADNLFGVRQEWLEMDHRDAAETLFGVELLDIEPGTQYTFSTDIEIENGSGPIVCIFCIGDSGTYEPIEQLIIADSKERSSVRLTFSTGSCDRLRIATRGPLNEEGYPTSVVWDNWKLVRASRKDIENIAALPNSGLLVNGSFERWLIGASAPAGGYQAPLDPLGKSRIAKNTVNVSDESVSVFQAWEQSDAEDPVTSLFGITCMDLQRGTNYKFSFSANTQGNASAEMLVYGSKNSGSDFEMLANAEAPPYQGYKEYEIEFNTGEYSTVRFVTRYVGVDNNFPNRVFWDDWHLARVDDES